jgi:transposase
MGRRSKLEPEISKRILEAVSVGCTYEQAAEYAGIHVSTFYAWMARGREESEGVFSEFHDQVKKANSKSAIANLAIIQRAARDGSWTAAAWILERRHGFTNRPEPMVEINIDAANISIDQLLEEVKATELQIAELIEDPKIDLEE